MSVFLVSFLLFFSFASTASDSLGEHRFKLSMSVGNPKDRLSVKNSDQTKTDTDFDQIEFRPTFVYFIDHRLAFGSYYFQKSFLADFDSHGFGGFARYYFLNDGTISRSKIENKIITLAPTWTPYFQLGAKKETLEAGAVSISFSGFEASAGIDWHWQGDYFINVAAYSSSLLSGQSRSLTSISFLLGLGKNFSL